MQISQIKMAHGHYRVRPACWKRLSAGTCGLLWWADFQLGNQHSPHSVLVNTMLNQAITHLQKEDRLPTHSDRGYHDRKPGWIRRMEKAGLERFMSKKVLLLIMRSVRVCLTVWKMKCSIVRIERMLKYQSSLTFSTVICHGITQSRLKHHLEIGALGNIGRALA